MTSTRFKSEGDTLVEKVGEIEITSIVENEDGSSNIEFEASAATRDFLAGEGMVFLFIKGILDGTTSDILRWATTGKDAERGA
jgi:hypothetical protein